ncbi:MAG TPA: hypothetical protein VMG11_15660 [Steroidobacteraceae bacterium]|nr:hypothetical protein [Steroidobacteraceae bacterium]
MTLAAGFLCTDGVVVARATERSGSAAKWTPTEIFVGSGSGYEIAVTGIGNAALIRMAADQLLERSLEGDEDLSELWEECERLVNRLSKKYIFCYGERDPERPQLQLLVAARMREQGSRLLLRSDANRIAKSDGFEVLGHGSELARSVTSWLYEPGLTVSVVARLVTHIVHWTAEHVPGCGRTTQVLCLSGAAQTPKPVHAPAEEEFFWGLNRLLQPIITGCIDERITDVQFDDRLRWFEERLSAVRQAGGAERRPEADSPVVSRPKL